MAPSRSSLPRHVTAAVAQPICSTLTSIIGLVLLFLLTLFFLSSQSTTTNLVSSALRMPPTPVTNAIAAVATGAVIVTDAPSSSSSCDCVACNHLLVTAKLPVPLSWSSSPNGCECNSCTALIRISLRVLGGVRDIPIVTAPLETDFGNLHTIVDSLSALISCDAKATSLSTLCNDMNINNNIENVKRGGVSGGGDVPVAIIETATPLLPPTPSSSLPTALCPKVVPCPLCPKQIITAAAAAAAASSSSPLSSASSQGDVGHISPAWSAARDVRGNPALPCSIASAFGVSDTSQCDPTKTISVPTRCVVGRHEDHWDFFSTLVRDTREPFALLRFVDGERMILQGVAVGTSTQAFAEDKWSFDGGESRLQKDMLEALHHHYGEPVFYAFATPQDDEHGLRWYLERTEATCGQITLANLWINSYYARTKALLLDIIQTQASRVVIIANHAGVNTYAPCAMKGVEGEVLGCIAVPDDAVHTWEDDTARNALLDEAIGWVEKAPPGTLFIMCAGPLSKPLVAAMWARSRLHQIVDFGSSLDEVLKKKVTRPYMDPNSPYSKGVDPQWFCHRGPNAVKGFENYKALEDGNMFEDSRCHTFSIPEGE